MSDIVKYKLIYFDIRVMGEPIRLILSHLGISYEDVRLDFANWKNIRNTYKWRQLPELHLTKSNGETLVLTQSTPICRYLANLHPTSELMPEDILEKMRCEELGDAVQDTRIRFKPYLIAKCFGDADASELADIKKQIYEEQDFGVYLSNLNDLLKEKKSPGDFVTGDKPRWIDFFLANYTSIWEQVLENPNLLDPLPLLKKQKEAVNNLPNIKAYLAKRKATVC